LSALCRQKSSDGPIFLPRNSNKWEVSGFYLEADKNCAVLGYYAACGGDS
jgi:hypothetical protein